MVYRISAKYNMQTLNETSSEMKNKIEKKIYCGGGIIECDWQARPCNRIGKN